MPVGRVGRRGMPVFSSFDECLRGCKSEDTVQTAHYVRVSMRPKSATFVTPSAARIDGCMRAADGARARRQLSKGMLGRSSFHLARPATSRDFARVSRDSFAALESIVDRAVTTDRAGVTGRLSAVVRRHSGSRAIQQRQITKANQQGFQSTRVRSTGLRRGVRSFDGNRDAMP